MIMANQNVKLEVARWIADMLNCGVIPEYLKEGRLVLLSKDKGNSLPEINELRSITINSQILKIVEKTLINRLR